MAPSFSDPPVEIGDSDPVTSVHAGGTPNGLAPGYVLERGEGPAHWFLGGLITMKARARDTDGAFGLMEFEGPRGWSAPGHLHDKEAETFYVLDGTLELSVGDTVRECVTPGAFVYVPPRTVHEWRVTSSGARFLLGVLPGGFEHYFELLGEPAQAPVAPYTEHYLPTDDEFARVRAAYKMTPRDGLLKIPPSRLPVLGRLLRTKTTKKSKK